MRRPKWPSTRRATTSARGTACSGASVSPRVSRTLLSGCNDLSDGSTMLEIPDPGLALLSMLSLAEPASWPDDGEIADDGTTVVTSTTSTMLTLSLEASFRLHVRFTNSSTPGQAEVSAPPDPLPPVSALKAVLRRACARFHLLHGPLTGLLSATGLDKEPESDVRVRHKLQSAVERYWSEWIDRFAARADSLLVDSHGLALPTIVTAANRTEAKLAQPYALISSTSITSSLSEQLPAELLHHLLSLVPPPDGPSSCAEAQYGGLELKDDPKRTNGTTSGSWWDGLGGLGSSMAGLTLGLGKNGSLARSLSPTASIAASERKSTSQTSSLWRKATADLLSFGSSAPLTPIAARLSPRLQDRKLLSSAPDVGPLSPAALSTSTASPPDPTLGGMTIDGAVDASTLKEAMEQDLPPPESVALRWAEAPVWLPRSGDRVQFIIATTVVCRLVQLALAKCRSDGILLVSASRRRITDLGQAAVCLLALVGRPQAASIIGDTRSCLRICQAPTIYNNPFQ